jgi:hypothetical protein
MKPLSMIVMMLTLFSVMSVPIKSRANTQQAPADTNAVQQAVDQLNQYASVQKSLDIQQPDLAYAMRQALTMADLLFNADGTLNLAIVSSVKSAFIPAQPEEYEVTMGKLLDQLDATWQPVFDNVTAPQDPNSPSNLVLRGLFSLSADQPVTDRHAKVAVLSAMLSPYNQGPVGDCFAVSDVIRDHDEYFLHIAEDYTSIIKQGYLERPVDNGVDYFFFLPILADDDRDQPFNLTTTGGFVNADYCLFEAPGFAAASTLMGGNAVTDLIDEVMAQLAGNASGNQIQVTPTQVIAATAQVIVAHNSSANADQLAALGAYAFSSLTNHPVARAVEAAIAAMAEDRAQDSTRGNINDCVAQALANTWTSVQNANGAAAFKQQLATSFNASYRLLYNLNIPLPQVSADGSSTDGGFQLYKRTATPTDLGVRAATPQDLRQLVLDAITASANALGATSDVQTIAQTLTSYVNTDDFLKSALWAYDPSNQQEPDPVKNYQKLSRTPMQSCDGDNPFEVSDIDTETTYDNNVQTYTPTNAKDLITWCLNLSKKAPQEMIPMDSPQHAFNFMPMNPDLVAFEKNMMSADQWIRKMLVIPGMQVARQPINAAMRKAVATGMYNLVSQVLPHEHFEKMVEKLPTKKVSLQVYAQKFLNSINQLLKSDEKQAREVALALDAVILQSLPPNAQAIISQSAIRFAFTNWNQGTKDIYFCAYFNPRTEQVGFGTIFEDKTNLQPMDENAWVNNQQWDVDLTPFAPKNIAAGS